MFLSSQIEGYLTCLNVTIMACPKLVKRQKQTLLNLVNARKMTKAICPKLVKVTSNLVDFYVDAKTQFHDQKVHN